MAEQWRPVKGYEGKYIVSSKGKTRFDVCLAWNTRAPILSAEEMEMLEGME